MQWLVQEANALNSIVLLLNILKACDLEVNPSLDVDHSEQEIVPELLIFIFVKSSAHQVNQQNSVLIQRLEISNLHGLLVPLNLNIWESFAIVLGNIVRVHARDVMAAILFAVIYRNLVFATHEKYESNSIWVCVRCLGIEYFVSVVSSLFYLSCDELFDLTYDLLGRLEGVVKIHIVYEFILKALAHDRCYIFNASVQEKIKVLLKLQVEGCIL